MTLPTRPTGEPLVVQVIREYKRQVMAREQVAVDLLVDRWLDLERNLSGQMDALIEASVSRQLTRTELLRLERYHALLVQIDNELAAFAGDSATIIGRAQFDMGTLGLNQAQAAIVAAYTDAGGVAASFNILPTRAIQNMVGLAGNGSPLAELITAKYPKVATQFTNTLVESTALGRNPRETARIISNNMAVGLNESLTIARTEQLRVFREAARQQYAESGVVDSYLRISARDTRVCPACLARDGDEYSLNQVIDEHPSGRCALVPNVTGLPRTSWQRGSEWFEGQPETVQREILGPGRYDLWTDGQFEFTDVAQTVPNDTWGPSLVPKGLNQLRDEG